ncbi:Sp110 nuclear body protein [Galemys pyrenaicus]|uniref:Sp110 nuclear body protein n=1 Tax=Galemys pyrenaicus TaxID=202257 RepID=A0A8J6DT40_GALPY|nr:Sp110 nuclear body protein [Galemys pyrenaicus]
MDTGAGPCPLGLCPLGLCLPLLAGANRVVTMTKAMEEDLRRHFTYKKLEIAYAISKPFPFVESLLDNAFITEKLYRVIYNILTKLEKSFNPSLLDTLFHPLHLYEYPNLRVPYKSFRNVVSSHGGWSRPSAILDMVDPAEGSSHQPRLLPLPAPQHPPPSPQPQLLTDPKPEGSRPRSPEILGEQPSPAGPKEATPGIVREERLTPESTDDASGVNKGVRTQELPSTLPSPVYCDDEDGAASSGHEIQEQQQAGNQATPRKDKSVGKPRQVTKAQTEEGECAPTPGPEGGLGLPDLPSGHPGRLPAVTNLSRSLHRERVQRAGCFITWRPVHAHTDCWCARRPRRGLSLRLTGGGRAENRITHLPSRDQLPAASLAKAQGGGFDSLGHMGRPHQEPAVSSLLLLPCPPGGALASSATCPWRRQRTRITAHDLASLWGADSRGRRLPPAQGEAEASEQEAGEGRYA